jgi:DNA-binding XRE family transcriptional regulator
MIKITLKAARVNAGLSQKEAAKALDVCNKTLCAWETGKSCPAANKIDAICNLYGIAYDNINFLPNDSL